MIPRSEAAYAAVRRGHRRLPELLLWNAPIGESTEPELVGVLPIEDGSLTVSLSRAQQRSGTVKVPGYAWWEKVDLTRSCWVEASIGIDGEVFPLGEWPVLSKSARRPDGIIDLQLGDWAFRRARAVAEKASVIPAGRTVAVMAVEHLTDVFPWYVACDVDDTGGAAMVSPVRVQPGGDVWAAMTQAANLVGAVLAMPDRAHVEVRIFDPLQPYMEDIDGTVNSEASTESAVDAVNRVVMVVDSEAPSAPSYRSVATIDPYSRFAYDKNNFGLAALVDSARVPTASQAAADAEARRVADRRFGVAGSMVLDVVAQPWLQAGDIVAVSTAVSGGPVWQQIDTITYPLTAAGRMRLSMRSTAVA